MPAIICLSILVSWVLLYFTLCYFCKQPILFVVLCIAGLITNYFVCLRTLILYFDLSMAYATTTAEVDSIAGGDGAKLVFTALFLAPATSVMLVACGAAINFLGRMIKARKGPPLYSTDDEPGRTYSPSQSNNPYHPPDGKIEVGKTD